MSSKSSSFVSGERSGADSFGPTCCENLHLLHNHYHLSRCHHNQHHPNPPSAASSSIWLSLSNNSTNQQGAANHALIISSSVLTIQRLFWWQLFSVENFPFPRWEWDFCRVRDCFIVKISRQATKLLFGAHQKDKQRHIINITYLLLFTLMMMMMMMKAMMLVNITDDGQHLPGGKLCVGQTTSWDGRSSSWGARPLAR